MLSKNSFEWPKPFGGFDVSYYSENDHWRCFEDSYSLYNLLFVHLCETILAKIYRKSSGTHTGSWFVYFTDDVGHTGLVSDESSKMNRLGRIIFRESLYLASMSPTPLLRQKANVSMTRGREFAMRLWRERKNISWSAQVFLHD